MGRTRTQTAAGVVLDTGALIALERGDRRMIALLRRALAQGRVFRVPAGVVGQACGTTQHVPGKPCGHPPFPPPLMRTAHFCVAGSGQGSEPSVVQGVKLSERHASGVDAMMPAA